MTPVLFARVGWMRWYRGPLADDEKPVGGGKYNKTSLGHEAFNFLPLNGEMLGYFQPMLASPTTRRAHPSHIALERIQEGFAGDVLHNVLTIFVATHPSLGKQRIVGWFRSSTVYRYEQESTLKERQSFSYFIRAAEKDAWLILDEERRNFIVPHGKGAFGRSNVCYTLEGGQPKVADWIKDALAYVNSYALENAAQDPASATDAEIVGTITSTLERAAGFQSNPRIRKAVEMRAMDLARKYLENKKYAPIDTHINKPYDFACKIDGKEVFVEVKGMQDWGNTISLTPREVEHAQAHENSALFVVHSIKIAGKRNPIASGGQEVFLYPWKISAGALKPRSYILFLADRTQAASTSKGI